MSLKIILKFINKRLVIDFIEAINTLKADIMVNSSARMLMLDTDKIPRKTI